eukprot:781579_1
MSTAWNCDSCELTNSYKNEHCQACFTPKIISRFLPDPKLEILRKIMNKQRILFDGFLRFESDSNFIILDIWGLVWKLFELNITTICKNIRIHKYRSAESTCSDILSQDLYDLAMILRGEKNYFIAYELMKELIDADPYWIKYYNAMGLILTQWHCFDSAEIYYKTAIDNEPIGAKQNSYKYNYGILLKERMKSANFDEKQADFASEAAYNFQELKDYYLKAIEMNYNKNKYWFYYAEWKCFENAIQSGNKNIEHYYKYAMYLRDFHKNYNLSKVYYLKCFDMNRKKKLKICGINASFGYLLYLMGEYEESNKYLSLAQVSDPKNMWTYFYYGLLHVSEKK